MFFRPLICEYAFELCSKVLNRLWAFGDINNLKQVHDFLDYRSGYTGQQE